MVFCVRFQKRVERLWANDAEAGASSARITRASLCNGGSPLQAIRLATVPQVQAIHQEPKPPRRQPQYEGSELDLDPAVYGQRRGRRDRARVLKHRTNAADTHGIAGDVAQGLGIEVGTEGRVVLAEQVLCQTVNLDVVGDLVARAQVDHGIARQRPIIVALVTAKELARHRDDVAANPPLRGDPVVETDFETM